MSSPSFNPRPAMSPRRLSPVRRGERGLTLIELMVGATIAMIALLIVSTVVITSNQQNKTTVSGSDAQTIGAMAAYQLERDLRMAGNALIFPSDAPPTSNVICEVQAYDQTAGTAFGLSMAPLIINAQPAGTPDAVTVFYGNPSAGAGFSTESLISYDSSAPTAFPLNNAGLAFAPGNLFLVAPVAAVATNVASTDLRPDCFMGENQSAVNTSPLSSSPNGTYTLRRGANTLTIAPQYNRPTGSPVAHTGGPAGTGDMVFNLGNRPSRDAQNRLGCDIGDCAVNRTYGISGNQLTMTENLLAPALRTAWPIADNVVMLKAQYGKDTNADGVVDTWDSTLTDGVTDANGDASVGLGDELWSQWNMVRAVRFSIVARSKTRDNDLVSQPTLTLFPSVPAPPALVAIPAVTWTLTTEQRHYRYRIYQTVVPLRNRLWSQ